MRKGRVDPLINGNQRKTIATGFDLPMGMTMRPDDAVYVSDRGFGFTPVRAESSRSMSPGAASGDALQRSLEPRQLADRRTERDLVWLLGRADRGVLPLTT